MNYLFYEQKSYKPPKIQYSINYSRIVHTTDNPANRWIYEEIEYDVDLQKSYAHYGRDYILRGKTPHGYKLKQKQQQKIIFVSNTTTQKGVFMQIPP